MTPRVLLIVGLAAAILLIAFNVIWKVTHAPFRNLKSIADSYSERPITDIYNNRCTIITFKISRPMKDIQRACAADMPRSRPEKHNGHIVYEQVFSTYEKLVDIEPTSEHGETLVVCKAPT